MSLLIGILVLVVIVELLKSSIEAVVDHFGHSTLLKGVGLDLPGPPSRG